MQTHALVMGNQLRYFCPLPGAVHAAGRAQERLFPGISSHEMAKPIQAAGDYEVHVIYEDNGRLKTLFGVI